MPLVVGQLTHRARRVTWQRVETCFVEPRVVRRVGEQRLAFLGDRAIEQLADLLEGAVESTGLACFLLPLADRAPQLVEAAAARPTAAHQLLHRLAPRQPVENR